MLHLATSFRLMLIGMLVVLGTAGLCRADEPANLLRNPGAEEVEGSKPLFWFAARMPADGLRMWRASDEFHTGGAALAISNEHEYEERVCNNWAQNLKEVPVGKALRLSAYVKTENADSVNLCIQCWDQTMKKMLAFGSSTVLRGNQDWRLVRSQAVLVPPETTLITVRAVLTGKGQVWFDDLSLVVVESELAAPAGDTKDLLLNPGAEQGVDEDPLVWFAACVPADGLRMLRATDECRSGKASLAIWNEHEYEEKVCNNWAQKIWGVPAGKRLELSGYVKTEDAEAVNLCIQCWDQAAKRMLAFGSTPVLRGSQEWLLVRSQAVLVPPKTASITVRAVLTGKGRVWFDDLSLEVVDAEEPGSVDARLYGLWTGYEHGNAELKWTAVFCAHNMIFVSSSGEGGCGIGTVDTTKEPHHIEATVTCVCPYAEEAVGLKVMGIYKIEGDTLIMSFNAPGVPKRPADFGAPGSRTMVLTRQE